MTNPYAWAGTLWIPALFVLAAAGTLFAVELALRWTAPRVAAIARATAIEGLWQPIFAVEAALLAVLLALIALLPYNTFGEDVKVMKTSGLMLLLLFAAFLAAWTASLSIADELEGRTALTVLSKPVTRRQFLVGKFLGVATPAYVLLGLLGGLFLVAVSFKVNYDARESFFQGDPAIQCRAEMLQTIPGLMLAWIEVAVLSSISSALATRLPLVPNLIVCLVVFFVGHLVPLIVQSSVAQHPYVAFVGRLLATVFPVLEHFSIQAAIDAGRPVPLDYVAWTAIYGLLYSSIALLVALVLFEDRDLA